MVPAVALVGRHNTGKTTLLRGLVQEFKAQGFRVGVLKSSKEDAPSDAPGKDTTLFQEAGADVVAFWGKKRLQVSAPALPKDDFTFWTVVFRYFAGLDLVLVEGLKGLRSLPKIEVYREGLTEGPLWEEGLPGLIACVGPRPAPGLAHFGPQEVSALAAFIKARLPKRKAKAELVVDERPVGLTRFVAEALWASVGGFVESLRGVKAPHRIELRLWR